MRIYIAGPMTGIPQFNIPAFDAAAADLRSRGYDVVSPAELDDPETRAAALASETGEDGTGSHKNETWGDFLARDVKLIADQGIEGIVCLRGWKESKGARLETFVGRLCGLPIFEYAGRGLIGVYDDDINDAHGWRDDEGAVGYAFYSNFDDLEIKPALIETEDSILLKPMAPGAPLIGGYVDGNFGRGGAVTVTVGANPKDAAATRDQKPQLHLLEYAADCEIAQALANGAFKYGRKNFHTIPILANVYGGAIRRHVGQWLDGEDFDKDSGLSHLAHIGANIHVVFAAMSKGMFTDDRGPEERSEVQQRMSDASNRSVA